VFADVSNDMRIAREEIFGPVLSVIPYDGDDEAVAIANDSDYGLAGSVWTVLATPSAATFSALGSVSCSSPVHCVAVGARGATATGTVSPLTEVWNGSAWTVVTAPK